MKLKGKRIFVSGGAGVIGRVLVEKLLSEGGEVFIGDLKSCPAEWTEKVKYRQGDLNYISEAELLTFNPQVFFHLAATFERSVETFEFWDENYRHNLRLSNYLMSILKKSSALERVVFASSYLIYNSDQYLFDRPAEKALRLEEDNPICPRNLCGTAKLMHEMELEFLGHFPQVKFSTVSARIFRVYGKNSRDIISRWIRALLKEEEIIVYKEEGLFDYIYAGEVAEGLFRLAQSDVTGIVNLGNDNARRVSEVLDVLKRYFPDMKVRKEDSDIQYEASQANMDKFNELIGWKPSRQLEDVIPELIEHEKMQKASLDSSETDFSILVTSISAKVPLLNLVREASLKLGNRGKIIGADTNPDCIGANFVDEFWKMPSLAELSINELIDFCQSRKIKGIIPTRDGELEFFSGNRKPLQENGISVMVSSPESVRLCLDKIAFHDFLKSKNIPAIPASENITDFAGDSFVVKERFGAGSRSIGLNLSKENAIHHARNLKKPIFQPFVQGTEVSVDVYRTKGKTKGVVLRTRDSVSDGESQVTTTFRNEELEHLSSRLADVLDLYGHSVMQVFIDNQNKYHFIECNPRFGGASSLSVRYGLDSFYWFFLEILGANTDSYNFFRPEKNLKQVRYKADLIL